MVQRLLRDSALAALVVALVTLLTAWAVGRLEMTQLVAGAAVGLVLIVSLMVYGLLLELREDLQEVRIRTINDAVSHDVKIISMEDFIAQEARLHEGDSVLLFANTLEYDRKHFVDTIANNLRRGVRYYYLMGGADVRREWALFLHDLQERGATQKPEGRFNTPEVSPLLWTTAIYEYRDPTRPVHAISILEHIYDSNACIELSEVIARRMKEHFWKYWYLLEESTE